MIPTVLFYELSLSLCRRQIFHTGASIGRTGGGVNGANRLGGRGFGRGATFCPRNEVVLISESEET